MARPAMALARAPQRPPRPAPHAAWGVPLAFAAALLAVAACRAREGERCVCAEDCREGLSCVISGRVLAPGECTPTVGKNGNAGVCLPDDEAADADGGDGLAEPFMDLGSKLDFEPGPPPDPETDGATGTTEGPGTTTETTGGTTEATGTTGGTTGSTGGTTDASGSSTSGVAT